MSGEEGAALNHGLRILIDEAQIAEHVRRLADAIARDAAPDEPLVIVAVMKGALVFLADLVRCLPMPVEIELVEAKSYRGTRRQERVEVLSDAGALGLAGRHVLLLDCVLDSGSTLRALRGELASAAPASLRTCVLLRKERADAVEVEPEYVGLDVPDVFLVGYGLDHANRWRHLPFVAELPPEDRT